MNPSPRRDTGSHRPGTAA
ncbi:hypothetical protein Nmel_017641 [Mimus melanotis]